MKKILLTVIAMSFFAGQMTYANDTEITRADIQELIQDYVENNEISKEQAEEAKLAMGKLDVMSDSQLEEVVAKIQIMKAGESQVAGTENMENTISVVVITIGVLAGLAVVF